MSDTFIPSKTVEKLSATHPKGTRHKAMLDIAISLIGNGMAETAVFAQLRSQFEMDVTDKEIGDVISWANKKNPTPSGYGGLVGSPRPPSPPSRPAVRTEPKKSPLDHSLWWLGSHTMTAVNLVSISPVQLPTSRDAILDKALETLYQPEENLNIVRAYTETNGKTNPSGGGKTISVEEWRGWVAKDGVPCSDAGAWVRPNPCKKEGSGKGGAITDDDIQSCRFLLLEFDELPIEIQLALYSKLKLPISAVILSGGKSAHAWVRIACKDRETYNTVAKRIIDALLPFGVDAANKNAGRLSRLPGAIRKLGAVGDGEQSLLWLDGSSKEFSENDLVAFEESLLIPLIDDRPLRRIVREAACRYDELFQNRGRLGIATGITEFDQDTGGLKNGQMVIIAANTGIGKSTLAMNMINTALLAGVGVALFSMEMDRDEICDILVSMNCRINRNVFNTGHFSEEDAARVTAQSSMLSNLPLWIFDEPVQTPQQMRTRTMQLSEEGKIGLVVIDYVQFTSAGDSREPREQQIAGISRAIRSLAKESKKAVVALSQLNDEGKLRESRVIAHDAHTVIMLEGDMQEGKMKMRVVKGRSIPKKEYMLMTEARYCRMYSPLSIRPNVDDAGWVR